MYVGTKALGECPYARHSDVTREIRGIGGKERKGREIWERLTKVLKAKRYARMRAT